MLCTRMGEELILLAPYPGISRRWMVQTTKYEQFGSENDKNMCVTWLLPSAGLPLLICLLSKGMELESSRST